MNKLTRTRSPSSIEQESSRSVKRLKRHDGDIKQDLPGGLQAKNAGETEGMVEQEVSKTTGTKASNLPYIILHRVFCSREKGLEEDHSSHPELACYHDQPRLFAKDTKASALRGLARITDVDAFVSEAEGLSFLVYKDYNCDFHHHSVRHLFTCTAPESIDKATFEKLKPWFHVLHEDSHLAWSTSEEVKILDLMFERAFKSLVARDTEVFGCYRDQASLHAPYDFFYHFLDRLSTMLDNSKSSLDVFDEIKTLLSYIRGTCHDSWGHIRQLFRNKLVSMENFSKLFYPGNIVVQHQDGFLATYLIDSLEVFEGGSLRMSCWNYAFDGNFRKQHKTFIVAAPVDEVDMKSLTVWPLRLDDTGLEMRIEQRGLNFWQCRHKRLVSYQAPQFNNFELQVGKPKYMVDIDVHRTLHPKNYLEQHTHAYEDIDISATSPPGGKFVLLLPTTVPGFGFHDKKWRSLQVDYISDVTWNEHAFNRLVLKANKKELIQALVTIHLENNQAADVIEGKGAGLIMLLHGPPGTGKTLTAETVSELANKPLYRVTCGDIGTDAESVEKYLESSLYLGTIWDCVVLLDEADVFLEERTQTDLARNALVSVFLRVLEYFNGILLLTSNRVGLFDEAFKSRMQLAIRYEPLDEAGRFKIWDNFFNALKKADVEMEFDDLSSNVKSLARKELNGRQIRNAIKTARQLAAFRKQKFGNQHLECAIEVLEEFEQYLVDTRGPDAYYARQQRLRYD